MLFPTIDAEFKSSIKPQIPYVKWAGGGLDVDTSLQTTHKTQIPCLVRGQLNVDPNVNQQL